MFFRHILDWVVSRNQYCARTPDSMATILNDVELKRLLGAVIVNGDRGSIKPNSYAARFTPIEAKQINDAIRQVRQSKSEWIRRDLLSLANGEKTVS